MVRNHFVSGLFLSLATCFAPSVQAAIVGFNYTGNQQQFVVPTDVYTVRIRTWGAQGQSNAGGVAGGLGGFASGDLIVNPGDILYIYVGGGGDVSTSGGWNGGGNAGAGFLTAQGGGGGGASDVRHNGTALSDRAAVGAGGGGAGGNRIVSQGRGTGGGGGGGWYGGGGGVAGRIFRPSYQLAVRKAAAALVVILPGAACLAMTVQRDSLVSAETAAMKKIRIKPGVALLYPAVLVAD